MFFVNFLGICITSSLNFPFSFYTAGAACFGKLAVAGVIICLCTLVSYIFRISLKQKNNFGYIIGCACGIIMALQCISNILIVFGILPYTDAPLPLISNGTSACIVNYTLLGLILSIYRYKDIRTENSAVNLGKAE
ncbi:MAG: FtsW/RodA/SpoVE family cell cycle protein [Firmicutes bacterium]|nr:FtsW/RodA/SpoVE family cell cycle protein [Bacillota bacterium]